MKISRAILVAVCVVAVLAAGLRAGSIWEKSKRQARALHTDDTARAVGDTITIAINENTVIANETKRDNDKQSSRTAKISGKMDLVSDGVNSATGGAFNLNNLNYQTNAETKFLGDAKYNVNRSVTDQITVTVQDVLPNGNLVVMGIRERDMHGDTELIQLSGIVRPSDINFSNIIASDKIADFRIVYRHKGMENQFTKPGWLDHFLNLVSPY
jgi:flagellar L-ring protein precursor FlgH